MKTSVASAFAFAGLAAIMAVSAYGCSSSTKGSGVDPGTGDDGGGASSSGGFQNEDSGGPPEESCAAGTGLTCQIDPCTGTTPTTITGQVFDPAGKNPLYNVQVYVPNEAPTTFSPGASCGSCSDLYSMPVAGAVTDASGTFTITKAPSGTNIPLIVQVGKWRMIYKLPTVTKCTTNEAGTILNTTLRLPRNHNEGDIPNVAISTGGADSLE